MMRLIRNLLADIIDRIDAGNSQISEEEGLQLIHTIKTLTDKSRFSKYSACQYLNISRATFDNYVREGKLPKGNHAAGFKELFWSKEDLDNAIINLKNKRNGN